MKHIFLFIIFLCSSALHAQEFKLQAGDLIFQEGCGDNTDNTIKAVTNSIDNYRFTHIGIVYIDVDDRIYVLEATHPRVAKTSLQDYLYPKNKTCVPKSVVGRLKQTFQPLIPDALKFGLKLIGKEYDDGFVLGNDKYYCSEFVYEILYKANENQAVFPLNIMTFKSPTTGDITDGWKEYFRKYDLPIPEGELGINPGAMSQSEVIDIVYYY